MDRCYWTHIEPHLHVLPDYLAETMRLRFEEHMTFEAIALKHGVSITAPMMRVKAATAILRAHIRGEPIPRHCAKGHRRKGKPRKLTSDQVTEICWLAERGFEHRILATRYGVSESCIYFVVKGLSHQP